MKTCKICLKEKPKSGFRKVTRGYLNSYCIPCQKEYNRDRHLRVTYGITREEYNEMLESQGGTCAICDEPPKKRELAVDHCHDTGQVRGLLCYNCNTGLGRFKDNTLLLQEAIIYLRS